MWSEIDDITIVKMGMNEYSVRLVNSLQGIEKGTENTDKLFCFN